MLFICLWASEVLNTPIILGMESTPSDVTFTESLVCASPYSQEGCAYRRDAQTDGGDRQMKPHCKGETFISNPA